MVTRISVLWRRAMPNIHHQFQIRAPMLAVFDAFTTPEGLNSWWTLEAGGEPELDSQYRLYFGPEYDWLAKVIHIHRSDQLTWSPVHALEDWMPTQFGFTLYESGLFTGVRFSHTGWVSENDHFAVTNFCWGQLLNGLKSYLEHGVVIPFANRNESNCEANHQLNSARLASKISVDPRINTKD